MNIHDWSTDTEYKSTAHITSYMSKFILSTFLPTKWKKIKKQIPHCRKQFQNKISNRRKRQNRYPEHTNVIKIIIVCAARQCSIFVFILSKQLFEQYMFKFVKMWNNHVLLIHVIVNRTNIKYVKVEWNCQRLYIWECKADKKIKC